MEIAAWLRQNGASGFVPACPFQDPGDRRRDSLEPGTHRVVFRCFPPGLAWGVAISMVTATALCLFRIRSTVASRLAEQPEQPHRPGVS
ncbi:MAG: hypothetical protein ACLP7Q_01900 [Isosphaeraceae bacterium]